MQHIHMQRHARLRREAVEDVGDHLAAQLADLLARQLQRRVAVRPRRQIDHRARQRLVQRRMARPEAPHAADRAERLLEGGAQRQRTVLGRVVVVNPQVALALQLQRQAAVLGERVQHLQ